MKKIFIFFIFFNNLCAMMSTVRSGELLDYNNQDVDEPSFLVRFRINQICKEQAPEQFWTIEASFEKEGDDSWFIMKKCSNRPVKIYLEEELAFFHIDENIFRKVLQEKKLLDWGEQQILSEKIKFKILSWIFIADSHEPVLEDGSDVDREWNFDSSTEFCAKGFFWCNLSEWCSVYDISLDAVEATPFFKYFLNSQAREDLLVRASSSGLRKGCRAAGHFFNFLQSSFQIGATAAGVLSRVCNDFGKYQQN